MVRGRGWWPRESPAAAPVSLPALLPAPSVTEHLTDPESGKGPGDACVRTAWRPVSLRVLQNCHDDAAKFVHLLMNPGCNYLVQEDFIPFLQVRACGLRPPCSRPPPPSRRSGSRVLCRACSPSGLLPGPHPRRSPPTSSQLSKLSLPASFLPPPSSPHPCPAHLSPLLTEASSCLHPTGRGGLVL